MRPFRFDLPKSPQQRFFGKGGQVRRFLRPFLKKIVRRFEVNKKILIVDDMEINRVLLAEAFKDYDIV